MKENSFDDVPGDYLLLVEFRQCNEYARSSMSLLVSWFTFFLTVNYFAIGWFISQVVQQTLKSVIPVYFITAFFLVQNLLAVGACQALKHYFIGVDDRLTEILENLQKTVQAVSLGKPLTCLPAAIYLRVIQLMIYTVCSLMAFWLSLLAVAVYFSYFPRFPH
jgi:hypothetical protein